jgi:5-methylcytosine-specific restriction endonuclease McrA
VSNRQVDWANRAKTALFASMGNCCWACGSPGPLEIDHINGRDWHPRLKGFQTRISIYRREWREGKVRALCAECNSRNEFRGVTLPPPPGVVPGRLLPTERARAIEQPF